MEKVHVAVGLALGLAIGSLALAGYLALELEDLQPRLERLEGSIITVGLTIDYGGENLRTKSLRLTKGATALEALRRVAAVETKFFPGLGEYIVSVDGVAENHATSTYWMWYLWNEAEGKWELAPVGAGSYELVDGDNLKFSYETVSW